MPLTFTSSLTGLDLDVVIDALLDNTLILQKHYKDETAPTNEGAVYYDATSKTLFYRDDSGAVEVGTKFHATVDFNSNQLKNARAENVSGNLTPSSGTVGRIGLDTGRSKLRLVAAAATEETIVSVSGADYMATPLPLYMWKKGTTAPSDVTVGSTPTVDGWSFPSASETARVAVRVPKGAAAANLILRLFTCPAVAETSGDDEDWTCDWLGVKPGNNEALTGTSGTVAYTQDLGTSVAQYAVNAIDIPLQFDAASPIAAGDLLFLEIHRTDLALVGTVYLLGAQLLTPCGDVLTE